MERIYSPVIIPNSTYSTDLMEELKVSNNIEIAIKIFESNDLFLLNKNRFLLDWIWNSMTINSTTANAKLSNPALDPQYWNLLTSILSSDSISPMTNLKTSILNCVTSVIAQLEQDKSVVLLESIQQLLKILFAKFSATFRSVLLNNFRCN
jgi:hypothetical protein